MIIMHRLVPEFKGLQHRYGSSKVVAPKDLSWMKLMEFPLTPGQYNLRSCTVLIMIPHNYDLVCIRECYVDIDLRRVDAGGQLRKLPHVHTGYRYERDGYRWLCLESGYGENSGLIGFIDILRTYFTDPEGFNKVN